MSSELDEGFRHPEIPGKRGRDSDSDDSEIETPSKKPKAKATPHKEKQQTPVSTPRTETRYAIEKAAAIKIAKRLATLPNIVELITFMIAWPLERGGDFTDKELGEKLNAFMQQIVSHLPQHSSTIARQENILNAY